MNRELYAKQAGSTASYASEAKTGYSEVEPPRRPARQQAVIETPPSLRDKYRFVKQLGHGAQGRIYQAVRLADDHTVAIKQLNIASVKSWKEYELFRREATVLESLNIEGVAHFYEAIECLEDDPPCSYIVQEYIPGYSLAYLLNKGHRFSLCTVYDIILQMLDILEELHSHVPPVIHRDIKPSNILLLPMGGDYYKVFLIDFGAVSNPQIQGGGSTVAGTFGYMPPEQLTGKPSPASDIYAFAAVIVYLLSGRSPADMPQKDFHLIFEPDLQNMPPALVNTLRRMLEPNADNRLCDIAELRRIFTDYQNSIYNRQSENATKPQGSLELALEQVESIGQSGNLDLWQALPDETPRNCPKVYQDIWLNLDLVDIPRRVKEKCIKERGLVKVAQNREKEIRQMGQQVRKSNAFGWGCLGVYLAFQGVQVFMGLGMVMVEFLGLGVTLLIMLGFTAFTFYMIYLIGTRAHRRKVSDFCNTQLFLNSLGYSIDNRSKKLRELICFGRKSIATIYKIEYYPRPALSEESHGLTLNYAVPGFKIYYKFNPPDDEREEDIVHAYITQREPEGRYKVGDPLPILYLIYRDSKEIEHVSSMPFPVPVLDVISHSDIIDDTSAFDSTQRYNYNKNRGTLRNI